MQSYDILVVGGGPAGYSAAIHAARRNSQVGLVESQQLGGTCLNRGCIPTKALLDTAAVLDSLVDGAKRGIDVNGSVNIDMPRVLRFKERVVKKMSTGIAVLLRENGIPVIEGTATIAAMDGGFYVTVTKDGQTRDFTTKKMIFAAGSLPAKIALTGADDPNLATRILTSDELLDLDFVPEKLLILGGGVIGVEAARIFRSFGSEIHLIEVLPRLLPFLDSEVSTLLTKTLLAKKIKITTEGQVTGVRANANGLTLILATGEEIDGSHLLIAAGRSANTASLSPELKTLLKLDPQGFIPVDPLMKTAVDGFFAPGDVNGQCMLAHAAIEMGRRAAEAVVDELRAISTTESPVEEYRRRIFEKPDLCELPNKDTDFFPFYVPICIYGDPEIGAIGWTEEQAREYFGDRVRIGRFPFAANGRAVASGHQEGFAKVVRLANSDRVVGVHLIGPGASELINEASTMLGESALQWTAKIHAHPTCGEVLVEAIADSCGTALHLPSQNWSTQKPGT